MIFLDPAIDGSDNFYTLGKYYPVSDPQFKEDDFSKRLLAIKYRHDSDPDPQPQKTTKQDPGFTTALSTDRSLALKRLRHSCCALT